MKFRTKCPWIFFLWNWQKICRFLFIIKCFWVQKRTDKEQIYTLLYSLYSHQYIHHNTVWLTNAVWRILNEVRCFSQSLYQKYATSFCGQPSSKMTQMCLTPFQGFYFLVYFLLFWFIWLDYIWFLFCTFSPICLLSVLQNSSIRVFSLRLLKDFTYF